MSQTTTSEASVTESDWSTSDAESFYHVPGWGNGYFFVNDGGHVGIRPHSGKAVSADVFAIAQQLRQQGVEFPALIRFQDLLNDRVVRLNEAFRQAISASGYKNRYQGVFPIKVNQLREVVEEIMDAGEPFQYGLECGSRSELIAALPFLEQYDTLLLCNGCKDVRMMEMMVAGQILQRRVLPIIERIDEYQMLRDALHSQNAANHGPYVGCFGVRVRLSTSGAGLWSESGGADSKFGISLDEMIGLVRRLSRERLTDRFQLLHFHLGSQIADIKNVRDAVSEAVRIYAWLRDQRIPIQYLDIGGGLGVNYEAGNPDAVSSINYDLQEYASTVVSTVKELCDEAGVPHPILVSESGRAVTAHHSVLVVEAIGARGKKGYSADDDGEGEHTLVRELLRVYREADEDKAREILARAEALRNEIVDAFRTGEISLEDKALAEALYWSICRKVLEAASGVDDQAHREIQEQLEPHLVDYYLCDFSIFRSMVDYWAIGQRFPIMPLHRLVEHGAARAEALRNEIVDAFRTGEISLEDKALAEALYWSICRKVLEAASGVDDQAHREIQEQLEPHLVDYYLCDFSIFRSMVDYWAIGQRFPIMPLHRLDEPPTRRAMLDDLTCDSDGRVSDFVSDEGSKHYLMLHPLRKSEPYLLGFFLMGAYQDIMGDMHNLFGRVTEAHVYVDEDEPGNFYIEKILPGADVREQLELVQYHMNELERRMSVLVQRQVRSGHLRPAQGVRLLEQYRASFGAYTYLESPNPYGRFDGD